MPNKAKQEELHWGVDRSNGEDSTGLAIGKGEKVWVYTGEEAEVLLELINSQVLEAIEKIKSATISSRDIGLTNDTVIVNRLIFAIESIEKEYRNE